MRVLMISGDPRIFDPHTEAYERCMLQRAQVNELRAYVWRANSPWTPFVVIGQALTRRFDVVTAQDPLWRGLLGLVAARLGGATFHVQVHGDLRAVRGLHVALLRITLWHADRIRVVSEKIKEQVENIGTRAYVDVLPIFVDIEAVRAAHAADIKHEFPRFGKFVLFVGRLEEEKNPRGALEVFKEVVEVFPGAGLIIVGSGSQADILQAHARNVGLADKVVFAGYRTNVPSLYKAADVMVVTSPYESFGAAIVQALAAGCPVVAPDVGVAREAGAIVVPRDKLAGAVVEILKTGARGMLKLDMPSKEEWARQWKQTLT